MDFDEWEEDTDERAAIHEYFGPPRRRRRKKKKSRELSSAEKAQREVDNRRRARVNARRGWDSDTLTEGDRMNRTQFNLDRLRLIKGCHQGDLIDRTVQLPRLEPQVAVIIRLPGNQLLLRNPASLTKAKRRSKSCMDLYHRLPGFRLGSDDPGEVAGRIAREAVGPNHSLTLIRQTTPWTNPIDRTVWVAVFDADGHDPDRWGWRARSADDHDLAPDESVLIEAFSGSST